MAQFRRLGGSMQAAGRVTVVQCCNRHQHGAASDPYSAYELYGSSALDTKSVRVPVLAASVELPGVFGEAMAASAPQHWCQCCCIVPSGTPVDRPFNVTSVDQCAEGTVFNRAKPAESEVLCPMFTATGVTTIDARSAAGTGRQYAQRVIW